MYGDFKLMVDWSIGDGIPYVRDRSPRKPRQKISTNKPRSVGLRKSKPLVSRIDQHLLHSGKNQAKQKTLTIRKVKRDSLGNVLSS